MDLNHRPPGPEDCSHEESITYTERYELLPSATSAMPSAISIGARILGSTQSGLVVGTKLGTVSWGERASLLPHGGHAVSLALAEVQNQQAPQQTPATELRTPTAASIPGSLDLRPQGEKASL
jgi:hypothetical protein